MTHELTTQQSAELTIAKQENEILKLKLELQKVQAQKVSKLEDSLFSPALCKHYQELAAYLANTTLIPENYIGKPGNIFIAMEMGYQLGLSMAQALQDISVINGRPCIYGAGLAALIIAHPDCEYINESPLYNEKNIFIGHECRIKRKGHDEHITRFTLQEAQKAGLLNKKGPWQTYPERMCKWRALGFAASDKFSDALRGIKPDYPDYIEGEYENISPQKIESSSQTEKLTKLLQSKVIPEFKEEPKEAVAANIEQIDKITELMIAKNFSDERKEKALAYYKVGKLEELTEAQADKFIEQLEKS